MWGIDKGQFRRGMHDAATGLKPNPTKLGWSLVHQPNLPRPHFTSKSMVPRRIKEMDFSALSPPDQILPQDISRYYYHHHYYHPHSSNKSAAIELLQQL